jgi:glycosyltransferase involved in cell wall biosynthesis
MRISIVTPNYNMGAYLTPTIQSVLANLAPGDEYFIIDGRSSDDSLRIIASYTAQLTGWVSERDRGYADAIAKGFKRATGDVVCWINSGDLLLPGAFDAARAEFDRTGAELIFGSDLYVDEDGRVLRYSHGAVSDLKRAMLYGGWSPLQDACFWTRDLYERIGGLDPDVSHAADYDLFLRMALQGKSAFSPLTFSAFRRHAGQKSIAGSRAYAEQKAAIQRREIARLGEPRAVSLARTVWWRGAMSLRARRSHRVWSRPDLEGTPVGALAAGRYWPA